MKTSFSTMKSLLLKICAFFVILLTLIALSPTLFKLTHPRENFLDAPKRLLVVFAHTDDEVTNSGLIRHLANQGSQITLLTLTDGTANPQSNLNECATGESITDCRIRELKNSANLLGAKRVQTPLLPDSALMHHLPQAAEHVKKEIEYSQPDAILTMEPSGLNGLEDHRAAFLSVAAALKDSPHKPRLLLSTLPWPISAFLPSRIPEKFQQNVRVFSTRGELKKIKVADALLHRSQASTIQGLTLGLGPDFLFGWIDFETYSIHDTADLRDIISK